jgi:hypothetical protein
MLRHGCLCTVLVLAALLVPAVSQAQWSDACPIPPESLDMNLTTLPDLAARTPTMEFILGNPSFFVYGTARGFVYLYEFRGDRVKRLAKTNLWKGIKEIDLVDLHGDGTPEVLVLTKEAMLYALTLDRLKIIWNTEEGYFEGISTFTVADMGDNGENEIIILADNHLFVFDLGSGYERWKSLVEHEATDIMAGDVDGDGMKELVLSDGTVLDSRLYEEEWIYEESFGHHIDLFDIDGDGVLEVISLDGAGDLSIVDVDDRARQWQ